MGHRTRRRGALSADRPAVKKPICNGVSWSAATRHKSARDQQPIAFDGLNTSSGCVDAPQNIGCGPADLGLLLTLATIGAPAPRTETLTSAATKPSTDFSYSHGTGIRTAPGDQAACQFVSSATDGVRLPEHARGAVRWIPPARDRLSKTRGKTGCPLPDRATVVGRSRCADRVDPHRDNLLTWHIPSPPPRRRLIDTCRLGFS